MEGRRENMSDQNGTPIENGLNGNGRDARGRFAPGNPGGPGSPTVKYATRFRIMLDGVLDEVVTPARLRKALDACMTMAEAGDLEALREINNRLVGPPANRVLEEKIEEIEAVASYQSDRAAFLSRQSVNVATPPVAAGHPPIEWKFPPGFIEGQK